MRYEIHSVMTFFNERKSTAQAKNMVTDVTIEGVMPSKEDLEKALVGDMAHKGKKVLMCDVKKVFRYGEKEPLLIYNYEPR